MANLDSNLSIIESAPIHYRVTDGISSDGVTAFMESFVAVKETACFYWVINEKHVKKLPNGEVLRFGRIRKVGKNAIRSFCHSSKERAINSYIKRKVKQLEYAKQAMATAECAIKYLSENKTIEFEFSDKYQRMESKNLGVPDLVKDWVEY